MMAIFPVFDNSLFILSHHSGQQYEPLTALLNKPQINKLYSADQTIVRSKVLSDLALTYTCYGVKLQFVVQ